MAGGFAHITVVAELLARLRHLDLSDETKRAAGMNMPFCEVGAVGPDYPYLAISLDDSTKAWADRMHYKMTGDPVRAGVRWLRQHDEIPTADRDKALAWLLGYAAHVGTDLTVHPVVLRRVGPYEDNAREHRICEMNQDTWIWKRKNLGTTDIAEYFDPIMRNTSNPDGTIAEPVRRIWESMLQETYPEDAAATPPDINAWHRGYGALIDVAEEGPGLFKFTRHLLVEAGLTYPHPNDIDLSYIENLDTPTNTMHYDDVFDHAINSVITLWEIIDGALTGSEEASAEHLARLPDADLDTGLTFADNTQAFWSTA